MPEHSVDDLARSFERHLRAANKSPRTVEAYLEAVDQFTAYLRAHRRASGSRGLADARGEDVEGFIVDLLGRHKPATAACMPSTGGWRTRKRSRIRCASSSRRPCRTSRCP